MNENLIGKALDIGEQMLRTGGEVSRVEDTISRLLKSYEFRKVNVFTITSQIQVTAEDKDGHIYNQFRRISRWGTDYVKFEELNQLSRDICSGKRSLCDVTDDSIASSNSSKKITSYLGGILATGGFAVFFGGSFADAIVVAILSLIVTYFSNYSPLKTGNILLSEFLTAVVIGMIGNLIVMLLGTVHFALNLDKILIGCIMLSIPGVTITYSVRDMLMGETITGLLRFIESLFIAASIACGYTIPLFLFGGAVQ